MRFIMTRARSLQPDVGLIGIYQAFAYDESPQWKQMPNPEQVREDMLSHRHGLVAACGRAPAAGALAAARADGRGPAEC